jgi:hypothetical protein
MTRTTLIAVRDRAAGATDARPERTSGTQDWRPFEKFIVDFFRRRGSPLRDVGGRPVLVAEFHDEETGERLAVRRVADLEELATELAFSLRNEFAPD